MSQPAPHRPAAAALGGVAHDLSNLLTAVVGSTELALERLPAAARDGVGPLLAQAVAAASQAADLCDLLQEMARGASRGPVPVDLSALAREVVDAVRPHFPPGTAAHLRLTGCLPAVRADRRAVGRVVLNLLLNAAQALPPDGGVVAVGTWTQTVGEEGLVGCRVAADAAGEYVALAVADTGRGMSPAEVERMFHDGFTTKGAGRGLGLATVPDIVRTHGGALRVDSAPGRGTTITLLLPAAVTPKERDPHPDLAGGRGCDRGAPD